MSNQDRDGLLAQFQSITGLEEAERATFFLEASNWNVDLAISSFFDDPDAAMNIESQTINPPLPVAQGSSRAGGSSEKAKPTAEVDEAMVESDESDQEEDGQTFYAGSGQQIVGPPKKKTGADLVQAMLKKAKESGAEAVDPSSRPSGSSAGASAFMGSGFKLGSSETAPSEMIAGASKPKPPKQFIIKMWQNGFSINDDGGLRSYKDPANKSFLASVMTGRIPNELVKEAENGEVHVDIEDHKEEEFEQPKGASGIKAFSGTGHTLGGITPAVTSEPPPTVIEDSQNLEQKAQDEMRVDDTQAVATVQIRLHDGKTMKVKLNHTHTVGHLRSFVTTARPDLASRPFSLRTSFPSKELEADGLNIKDAGLIGAAVLLRLK